MTTKLHGDAKRGQQTRLYRIWCAMRTRCNNPRSRRYGDYGARGITVCPEWSEYTAFRSWAMANGYHASLTIDRKKNHLGYSPKNCKWSTYQEQCRNKRNSRFLTIFGETKTMAGWAEDERCVVSYFMLNGRLHRGWNAKDALTTPAKKIAKAQPRMITFQGQTLSINAWAKLLGVKSVAIYARAYRGLAPEKILAPVRKQAPYGSRVKKSAE